MHFPPDPDPQQFDGHYRHAPELWMDQMAQLIQHHGLHGELVPLLGAGSNLLAKVDSQWVIKVFPPFHRHQWESECRSLRHLAGKLSFPIPALLHGGELSSSWTYAIMSFLEGQTLEHTWEGASLPDKLAIMGQIGAVMAEVHALPLEGIQDLPPRWDEFIQRQVEGCHARHTRLGAPAWLLRELPHWLQEHVHLLPTAHAQVLLTGEYTPFNLLATDAGSGLRLTSMIDFGDAMVGPPQYDWLGPAAFLCQGNPMLWHAFLRSYGIPMDAWTMEEAKRCLLLLLLHRYSNLRVQVSIAGWQDRFAALDELAVALFPLP